MNEIVLCPGVVASNSYDEIGAGGMAGEVTAPTGLSDN